MKFIREYIEPSDIQILTESTNESKTLYITGPFIQGDVKNKNGRIYPLKNIVNQINSYVDKYVSTNRALGELNHPKSTVVDPDRACIKIESLVRSNSDFIGKAKVLSTTCGNTVKALINDGVTLGVSTRGVGTVKEIQEGMNEVQDDFELFAVDVVLDPSAPDAFVQGIMESVEYYYDNGILKQKQIDELRADINKISRVKTFDKSISYDKRAQLFERFIKSIS